MDLRNVIFAISLSFAILVAWSYMFDTPEEAQKKAQQIENKNQDTNTPSVNLENKKLLSISREDAINSSERIDFENDNVVGSISLQGALILSLIHI